MTKKDRSQEISNEQNRIARFLLSCRPQMAEQFHSSMLSILDYQEKNGSLNKKWYRCGGVGHGYIRVDEKTRSGRIVRELPTGVLEADVVELSYDTNAQPLLCRMRQLKEELDRSRAGNSIRYLDRLLKNTYWSRKVQNTDIKNVVEKVMVCYEEDYDAGSLFKICQRGLAYLGSPDRMRQFSAETIKAQFDSIEKFETTGYILSQLLCAFYVALEFDDGKSGGSSGSGFLDFQISQSLRPFTFTSVFCFLMSAPQGALEFCLHNLLARAADAGHIAQIASAADQLRLVADQFLHDAKEAGEFAISQRLILFSMPWYQAAMSLYQFLSACPQLRENRQSTYFESLAVKGCEEKLVRCSNSLYTAIFDVSGQLLRLFADELLEARQARGRMASEQLLTEIIEFRYLYPRCFRHILMPTDRSN